MPFVFDTIKINTTLIGRKATAVVGNYCYHTVVLFRACRAVETLYFADLGTDDAIMPISFKIASLILTYIYKYASIIDA